jgi:hypothetical protein
LRSLWPTRALNLGIGSAVQAGCMYALERDFDIAVQVDGDGQHARASFGRLLEPVLAGRADMAIGTRFSGTRAYRAPLAGRIGIGMFGALVSLRVRQRMTDTTSGFRAVNSRGIRLFAADYPDDYPEVEAVVTSARGNLCVCEVPVLMRSQLSGNPRSRPSARPTTSSRCCSLLWLGTADGILVFAAWRSGLHELSRALGIAHPPTPCL